MANHSVRLLAVRLSAGLCQNARIAAKLKWRGKKASNMRVYAFDVDETLEISNGPVKLRSLMDLRNEGHIVGLCGNWAVFCQRVAGWQHLISFMNVGLPKDVFLAHLRQYIPADDYIMIGNVLGRTNSLGVVCGSDCSEQAARAGWRFILEDDFAKGAR